MNTLTLFRAYKLAKNLGDVYGDDRYFDLSDKLDRAITARLEHEAGQARLGRMVRNMTFGMHLVHAFYGAGPYENDSGWEVHCAGEHEYAMSPEGALDKAGVTA